METLVAAFVVALFGWLSAYFLSLHVVTTMTFVILFAMGWLYADSKKLAHTTPGVGILFIAGILFVGSMWITEVFICVDFSLIDWSWLSSIKSSLLRK